MGKRYPLVHPNVKGFLHGGDYNPDQWLHMPEIIDEDFRLMKLAHCQTFSINIFAWSKLEPKEGNMILPGWMISWIAWQRRSSRHSRHAKRSKTCLALANISRSLTR